MAASGDGKGGEDFDPKELTFVAGGHVRGPIGGSARGPAGLRRNRDGEGARLRRVSLSSIPAVAASS